MYPRALRPLSRNQQFHFIIYIYYFQATLVFRRQLIEARNQYLDIERFSEAFGEFQDKFANDCRLSFEKYDAAISQIEKSIADLQKTKDLLINSQRHLRLANDKAMDLSVKKLCKKSPSLLAELEAHDSAAPALEE